MNLFSAFNVQSWPKPKAFRALWRSDDDRFVLLQADSKQIEAAATAYFAQDRAMTEAMFSGKDIHTLNAAEIYKIEPIREIAETHQVYFEGEWKDARYAAKRFSHGRNYGMTEYGMSRKYGLPLEECRRMILAYERRWPAIARWQRAVIREAMEKHRLVNPFGRAREFWAPPPRGTDIFSWPDARPALSTLPQGTAGEMFKYYLRELRRRTGLTFVAEEPKPYTERVWAGWHDSLTLHVLRENAQSYAEILVDIMRTAFPQMIWRPYYPKGFYCPVDVEMGVTWAGGEKVDVPGASEYIQIS